MNIVNPATGEIIATVKEDDSKSLAHKRNLLKVGQKSWAARSLAERLAVITEFYHLLDVKKERLAAVLTSEVGKPVQQSHHEISGGKRKGEKGNYFEPTVLTNVTNHMKVMQEESFGPIIGIMKVNDDAEALYLMQDTAYGLTAAVYSDSRERAEKILSQIDSGTGYWNCCDRVSAGLPWSGRRHSGIGATLSHQGLRAFTKPKAWHLRS